MGKSLLPPVISAFLPTLEKFLQVSCQFCEINCIHSWDKIVCGSAHAQENKIRIAPVN